MRRRLGLGAAVWVTAWMRGATARAVEISRDDRTMALLAAGLVILAVAGRLMPHPPNFTPVAAAAIFGGAVLPRRWALGLPLAAMIVGDLIIGLHPLVAFTWGSFAAAALIGRFLVREARPGRVVAASLASSVLFYVVTNFGVWLQGMLYPMTAAGLVDCYVMALPFFRNTLAGDLVFTGVLFGAWALAGAAVKKAQKAGIERRAYINF